MKTESARKLTLALGVLAVMIAGPHAWAQADFCLPMSPGAADRPPAETFARQGLPAAKTILVLRISFANAANTYDTNAIRATNERITRFWMEMSRNQLELRWKIHPQVGKAPFPSPSSSEDRTQLFIKLSAYRDELAKTYNLQAGRDYDMIAAFYPYQGALGQAQSSSTITLLGDYSPEVMAHEPGHCLGLMHANAIDAGSDILGTPGNSGQHVEYGNVFDVMGRSSFGHLNAASKKKLAMLDENETKETALSGTYRIYAHDNSVHKDRLLALHVRTGSYGYWVEYRSKSSVAKAGNGPLILFEGFQNGYQEYETWALDMTPNSIQGGPFADIEDAALAVNKEFKDKFGGVTFKTVAVSNATRDQESWVDVQVAIPGSRVLFDPRARGMRRTDPGGNTHDALGRISPDDARFMRLIRNGTAATMGSRR
jgi:hypothetical protein